MFCFIGWCFVALITSSMVNAIKYFLFLELVYHESIWYYVTVDWIITFSLFHPYILMEVFFFLQDFLREVDPDIIIGYNICKFDLPYLIEVLTWLSNSTLLELINGRFFHLKQRFRACCWVTYLIYLLFSWFLESCKPEDSRISNSWPY